MTPAWGRAAGAAALAAALLPVFSAAQALPALTLAQAVTTALSTSPRLHAASAAQDKARTGVAAARAGALPTLDVSEGFVRSNNPVAVFGNRLSQQGFTAADFAVPALNQPAPLDNFQTLVSARVPLFEARQVQLRVQEAKLGVQMAANAAEQTRQGVILAVVSAFYRLAASQAELQVANQAVIAAQAAAKMARDRFHAGLSVAADRLSAQVYLAQAQEQQVAANDQVSAAAAALNRELGRPLDAKLVIAAERPAAPSSTATAAQLPLDFAHGNAPATRLRPELRRQREQLAIAAREVTRTRAAFLPRLEGYANWENDQLHFAEGGGHNWTLGLVLSWNVFRGGADRAATQAAVAQQREEASQLQALQRDVALQVRQAWLAVHTSSQQLQLSRSVAAQAQAALTIMQNRYRSGLATITALLHTQTELTQARSGRVQAGYNLEVSRANLALAEGTLSPQSPLVTGTGPGNATTPGGH